MLMKYQFRIFVQVQHHGILFYSMCCRRRNCHGSDFGDATAVGSIPDDSNAVHVRVIPTRVCRWLDGCQSGRSSTKLVLIAPIC